MATLTFPDNINSTAHSNFMQIKMTSKINNPLQSALFNYIIFQNNKTIIKKQINHFYPCIKGKIYRKKFLS